MYARFGPGRSATAVGKRCGCARTRYAGVQSSVAQSTAACAGPALGGGPARRQADQTQAADSMALTWRRTVKASERRPRLSPTFYVGAETLADCSAPLELAAPSRFCRLLWPDFPGAFNSSPDTDGVLQPRKLLTMRGLSAIKPAKVAPILERNHSGFPSWSPNRGLYTPTPLSARQISSSHVVPPPNLHQLRL